MVLFKSNTAPSANISNAKMDIHQICMNQHFTIYECLIKIDNQHHCYPAPHVIPIHAIDQLFEHTFTMAQKVLFKNNGLKNIYTPIQIDSEIPIISTKRVITVIINTAFDNPNKPTLIGQIYSAGKLIYTAQMECITS